MRPKEAKCCRICAVGVRCERDVTRIARGGGGGGGPGELESYWRSDLDQRKDIDVTWRPKHSNVPYIQETGIKLAVTFGCPCLLVVYL